MAGIFDIKTGAFDSSEAALLHEAYEIALNGLKKSTKKVDRPLTQRLARAVVKAARGEPDCLRFDGSIDPVKLAQRAILRTLQTKAPNLGFEVEPAATEPPRPASNRAAADAESPAKVMLRLFERTPFAKL